MAEAIREVVSSAILFDLADPRVHGVTVLGVTITGDLRSAAIAVSIMGSEAEQDLAMHGLRSATGFLQSKVAPGSRPGSLRPCLSSATTASRSRSPCRD